MLLRTLCVKHAREEFPRLKEILGKGNRRLLRSAVNTCRDPALQELSDESLVLESRLS
jgi:hypothetical protein